MRNVQLKEILSFSFLNKKVAVPQMSLPVGLCLKTNFPGKSVVRQVWGPLGGERHDESDKSNYQQDSLFY